MILDKIVEDKKKRLPEQQQNLLMLLQMRIYQKLMLLLEMLLEVESVEGVFRRGSLKHDVAALTGGNTSEKESVLDIVEHCVVRHRISEISSDILVNLLCERVAANHHFLNDFQFFGRA